MNDFFDYFQILCLALFLFLFVGRTIYLRRKLKINAITFTSGKKGVQEILELSLFIAVNVWIAEMLMYTLGFEFRIFPSPLDHMLINSMPAKITGVTLTVTGFAIFIAALNALGNSWRLGIDEEKPGELVTRGIYAISRNPVYIFFGLYFVGAFLINGTLIFLLFAIVMSLNLHYQILAEEKFLERKFGEIYRDYCAATNRYFAWQQVVNIVWGSLHFNLHKSDSKHATFRLKEARAYLRRVLWRVTN